MLMHPSLFLVYLTLLFSVLLVLSANSWFIVWMGLEMNLVFFIPLMLKKNNKYSNESSIKYFLTQTFASVLIISSALLLSEGVTLLEYILLGALFLKTGSAPFHQWLPSLVEGLSWDCLMVLFILQKMGPLLLISFLLKKGALHSLVYLVVSCSAVVGSLGGLMSASIRKIMAYSSISHMSWVLTSMMLSNFGWISYYLVYCVVLVCTLDLFTKMSVFSINQLMMSSVKSRVIMGVSLLSLGGLPPFTGFVPKFMVSVVLLENKSYFLFFVLLGGTFLSLFFYMRLVLVVGMLSTKNMVFKCEAMIKSSKLVLNFMGLILPSLFFMVL
uniref:NADH-ubiquinone oxidoreductase chain 2 n=1 Tax=Hyalella latimana TaxID=2759779 RepID=A0A7T8ZSP1_9CRUS|nr:NADH dehydrogenase subunit 2 [Hyalella latimana]